MSAVYKCLNNLKNFNLEKVVIISALWKRKCDNGVGDNLHPQFILESKDLPNGWHIRE